MVDLIQNGDLVDLSPSVLLSTNDNSDQFRHWPGERGKAATRKSKMGSLTMNRYEGAVAVLKHIGVFFLGGHHGDAKTTSDFLATGSLQWTQGPTLPESMSFFCAVPISPTTFITIHKDKIHEFDAAIAGPTSDEGWRESGRWETLKTCRERSPGCAKLGNKVILAGGYNGGYLRSTEVLDITTRTISAGGDMASARGYFSLATISSEGGQKLFALAGIDSPNNLNTVEEWVEESSTWKAAESLTRARGYFGVLKLQKDFICPS